MASTLQISEEALSFRNRVPRGVETEGRCSILVPEDKWLNGTPAFVFLLFFAGVYHFPESLMQPVSSCGYIGRRQRMQALLFAPTGDLAAAGACPEVGGRTGGHARLARS